MARDAHFDVVVVGSGPAGASTAFHLARKGWRVALFEKTRMPRVKACGDGLGTGSVAMLKTMGLDLTDFQTIQGVDLQINGESTCTSNFNSAGGQYGLVVPRSELDYLIARRAHEEGSVSYEGCQVTGFEIENGGINRVSYVNTKPSSVSTRFVVIADGGRSRLATQAGIPPRSRETTGYAVRGYYSNVPALPDLFRICLPLRDPVSHRPLPGYGWVFPLNESRANIGVGFYPTQNEDSNLNLRHLFQEFLTQLVAIEPRMANITLEGRWIGGPLHSGMDPARCIANRALVVGDAAGLVDPFTGEGIDTALVSGQFAAEALDASLTSGDPRALNAYCDLLDQRYRGRFQLGKRFVRTYAFMWRLFQTSVDYKGPLFDRVRQAVFSYNGSETSTPKTSPTSPTDIFSNSVAAEMKTLTSDDFPLFSRVGLQLQDQDSANLRQVLAYWSHRFGNDQPGPNVVRASACLELAKLAHGIQREVILTNPQSAATNGNGDRCVNSFAVMSGNYLLMKAFSGVNSLGATFTQLVASAAAQLCSFEIDATLTSPQHSNIITEPRVYSAEIEGLFCGAACKISARLGDCSDQIQAGLEDFGKSLGAAWFWSTEQSGETQTVGLVQEAIHSLGNLPNCLAKSKLISVAQSVAERTKANRAMAACPSQHSN